MIISPPKSPNLKLNWLVEFQKNLKIYIEINFFLIKYPLNGKSIRFFEDDEYMKNFLSVFYYNYNLSHITLVYNLKKEEINQAIINDIIDKLEEFKLIKIDSIDEDTLINELKESPKSTETYQLPTTIALLYFPREFLINAYCIFTGIREKWLAEKVHILTSLDNNKFLTFFYKTNLSTKYPKIQSNYTTTINQTLSIHYKNYIDSTSTIIKKWEKQIDNQDSKNISHIPSPSFKNILINLFSKAPFVPDTKAIITNLHNTLVFIKDQAGKDAFHYSRDPLFWNINMFMRNIMLCIIENKIINKELIEDFHGLNKTFISQLEGTELQNESFKIVNDLLYKIDNELLPQINNWNDYTEKKPLTQISR